MCALPWVIPGFVGGAVFSLASSLVLGAGIVGFTTSVSGLRHNDFSWTNLAKNIAADSMVTLLTFGSGFASGAIAGLALIGKNLTKTVINIIGSTAGSLVNTGVNTGCYVVRTYIEGESITTKSLIIKIGSGIWGGQSAARYATRYLKVEISALLDVSSFILGSEKLSSKIGNEIVKVYEYTSTL